MKELETSIGMLNIKNAKHLRTDKLQEYIQVMRKQKVTQLFFS